MADLQAILRLLQGAGGSLGGFSQDYATQAENAYQLLAQQLAGYDRAETELGTDYERQRAELGYQNEDATQALLNAMANRGTLKSGMTTAQLQRQGRQYTGLLDQLAGAKQSRLADLATNRLNAQGGYNQTIAGLQNAYAGKSNEYIAQQVAAAAQREQNQQQMLFNDQMTKQNMMFQQQMLNQMNSVPSYQTILGATGATGAAGTTGTTAPTQPTPTTTQGTPAPTQPKPVRMPSPTTQVKPRYASGAKAPYAV